MIKIKVPMIIIL